ncbi:Myb-like DNA-binding domain-containing protein [Oceanobacillus jeddahense]|uniref:RsfA family transcriptional regulator n=1 Tax=Oceanobacillus jeddahense TaxID=1462527 RepID=A0ABY5JMX2_9BACI|nr:Myb-like DNA-binding domain-containing protein [Oceanobacillus jeddahense]UUI01638.1 RsfA family transcriptional regulator [Oceanobacillus jeddahense]
MNDTRQDAWTEEEDRLLADTVLKCIQEGRTQLEAFKEVAEKLSRTSAACGFRWNAKIRKQCQEQVQAAKEKRKAGLKQRIAYPAIEASSIQSIDAAIQLLEKMRTDIPQQDDFVKREELNKVLQENKDLKNRVATYETVWGEINDLLKTVSNS